MAEKAVEKRNDSMQGDQLIVALDDFFSKAPQLPKNVQEVLVKIAPWLALIFGILGVIAGLGAVGISPVAALGGIHNSMFVLVSGLLTIVSSVLMLLAYPKLNKHLYAGWKLLFWSEVVSVVSSLLGITAAGLVGAVIGALIGFYLLYQIKPYYK